MSEQFDNILIDGKLYSYSFTSQNIHIENSHTVSKKFFKKTLERIEQKHPGLLVWNRSNKSLRSEWATHNFCYAIGYKRSQTADVDLDYPCDRPEWQYKVIGFLVWLFIK